MNERWKDIIDQSKDRIDPRMMIDYVEGRLSDEERHQVERILVDGSFEQDAVEGLFAMENRDRLPTIINQLQLDLSKKTRTRKKKLEAFSHHPQLLTLTTTILILLLAILGYVLYRMSVK